MEGITKACSLSDQKHREYFLTPDLAQPELTVGSHPLQYYSKKIFLDHLAATVDKRLGGYTKDGENELDTRKKVQQVTQTLLHTGYRNHCQDRFRRGYFCSQNRFSIVGTIIVAGSNIYCLRVLPSFRKTGGSFPARPPNTNKVHGGGENPHVRPRK
jgi:hypothetical protein